jgi:hypothetical protein
MRETFFSFIATKVAPTLSFSDNLKRFNDRSKEFLFGQQPV